jgi:hypothetical protein
MRRIVTPLVFVVILTALAAPAGHASYSLAAEAVAALTNPFTGLGHEGSGLSDARTLAARTTAASSNPFTGLGHEGSGLVEK